MGVGDADGDPAVGRSRVLTRRVPSPSLSRGADGAAEGPLARRWYSLSATGPSPLFEMRVERNPRDPDYDIKVHLAVDQVWVRSRGLVFLRARRRASFSYLLLRPVIAIVRSLR